MNRNGWNLVSVPLHAADRPRTTLFPSATTQAFMYDTAYIPCDTLTCGVGYWLKFPSEGIVALSGKLTDRDSIDVKAGWNLIGSLSTPITVASITSDQPGMITSDFFGFAGRYVVTDTILPGRGYWVRVNQAGKLILSSTGSAPAHNRIRIASTSELPPPAPDAEIANLKSQIPARYALEQNYPNPFNPVTTIRYQLPVQSRVSLKVYNVLGQVVNTLVDGIQETGYETAEFDASTLASGIYFCRLDAVSVTDPSKSFIQVKKIVLAK